MLTFDYRPLNDEVIHCRLLGGPRQLSFAETCDRWQTDEDFRQLFVDELRASPFSAFRWETPPICDATWSRGFEFVLIDFPTLVRPVDETAFARHFATTDSVVGFENLGHDAFLLVPCPGEPRSCYSDLASFLRNAELRQIHELWQHVGSTLKDRVQGAAGRPVWLSTAGMGVAWVHIRLDSYPKYYGYAPFRG